jgi:anti-sigma B factor antagonist
MDMVVNEVETGVTCIRLNGRLDAPGADKIDLRFTAQAAAGQHDTVVDLAEVSFVASMGLRLLIATARAMDRKGRRMVLFGAQPAVQAVLELAAIDQLIPLVADEAAALQQLRT